MLRDEREQRYQVKLQAYLNAMEASKQQAREAAPAQAKAARVRVLEAGIQTKAAPVKASMKDQIADDFRVNVLGEAPKIHVNRANYCEECNVAMLLISNDSFMLCPSCSKMRVLPLAAMGSAMYGGRAEFSTVSNSTKTRVLEWIEVVQAREAVRPPAPFLHTLADHLARVHALGTAPIADAVRAEYKRGGPFRSVADALARLPHIPDLPALLRSVDADACRQVMDAFKLNTRNRKVYDRAAMCAAALTGFSPWRLTPQHEQQLYNMALLLAPHVEWCRKENALLTRVPYLLRGACLTLGLDPISRAFPAPTDRKQFPAAEALRAQIWRDSLQWEFVPVTPPTNAYLALAPPPADPSPPTTKRRRVGEDKGLDEQGER
jgi:hypothetical protein